VDFRVRNAHERRWPVPSEAVAALLDTLGAGERDLVWPSRHWAPLRLDRPLAVGARGGHGAVRYRVAEYEPGGGRVVFAFEPEGALSGFNGWHMFEAAPDRDGSVLRHLVVARADLRTALRWCLLVKPIHDAAIEDALDEVERHLMGTIRQPAQWSSYVCWLRRRRGLTISKKAGANRGPWRAELDSTKKTAGNLAVAGRASASGLHRKETHSGIQRKGVPWPASILTGDV